jgi:DNA-directed RNA polymerase III subunit RPC1
VGEYATALGTATSGYMQRKIGKLCEDMKIEYDNTVRDVIGRLYQYVYGCNGFDPVEMVKPMGGKEMQFCDVGRMITMLNRSTQELNE